MLKIAVIAHLRHAIREPFAGGLEMHTHFLCKSLREHGHQVSLFAASGSDDPGLESSSPAVPMGEACFIREHRLYRDTMKALALRSFDIIHNNSLHYLPVAMAASLPMPMITTLHTPPFWELEGSMRMSTAPRPVCVAVSEVIRRAWQPIVGVEYVIPNGIDLDLFAFCRVPDVEPYVVWYGRIVPEKGLHLAIEAARLAGLQLRFAGPISDTAYYQQKILPAMDRRVRYLGHLSHVALAAAIGGARAFLCTPVWEEPYGLVVAESLACGTPVAAFARGAVPDLLDAGSGVLAKPNDVRSLAAATLSAQQLDRAACRHRAEAIGDARTMIESYELLYADMIARHPFGSRKIGRAYELATIEPTSESLSGLYIDELSTLVSSLPGSGPVSCR